MTRNFTVELRQKKSAGEDIKKTFRMLYDRTLGVTIGPCMSDECKVQLLQLLEVFRMKHVKKTQAEIAKQLGVTTETYNRWINGQVKPGRYSILKIFEYLNPYLHGTQSMK